jgi:hypothetical protein
MESYYQGDDGLEIIRSSMQINDKGGGLIGKVIIFINYGFYDKCVCGWDATTLVDSQHF